MGKPLDVRLATNYSSLSAKLRQAADYVVENPVDIATRSLRWVANDSDISPATFSRLAKALNYSNLEDLRDVVRTSIDRKIDSFSSRAERLQNEHGTTGSDFTIAHMDACIHNIRGLCADIDRKQMDETANHLNDARKVVLFGVLGSAGVVDYMAYVASFLKDNWVIAGRGGGSFGSSLAMMDEHDALIIVTKPPFASRVLNAAKLARDRGVYVVVISDSHACEALRHASSGFIVPSNSPHFFSSYTATIFLIETIIAKMAALSKTSTSERISNIQHLNRRMQEISSG